MNLAACCAEFYEQDWVQTFLDASFHPGGVELSRRLLKGLNREGGGFSYVRGNKIMKTSAEVMAERFLPMDWVRQHGLPAYRDSLRADIDLNAGPPETKDFKRLMIMAQIASALDDSWFPNSRTKGHAD